MRLYEKALIQTKLTTGPEEDEMILSILRSVLGEYDWQIHYIRTSKHTLWSFEKNFGTDPDLIGTRYDRGVTFVKLLDNLNSLETAIELALERAFKYLEGKGSGERDHVELAIRRDSNFWLVRSYVVGLTVNYYVPSCEKGRVLEEISQAFSVAVEPKLIVEPIDADTSLINLALTFSTRYRYKILSRQLPSRLVDNLGSVARRHFGPKYGNREDIGAAIVYAYAGQYEKAKKIILENSSRASDKIGADLLRDIKKLERLELLERDLRKSSEDKRREIIEEMASVTQDMRLRPPAKSIYQLDVDILKPLMMLTL